MSDGVYRSPLISEWKMLATINFFEDNGNVAFRQAQCDKA